MNSFTPFLTIAVIVLLIGNRTGLEDIDPPVNYNTHPSTGIVRPYNPLPQMPKAMATPAPASCPDYGEYNGTLMAQMLCEMEYHGELSEETLRQADEAIALCEQQRNRTCN